MLKNINKDIILAMKNGDKVKLTVLRMLKTELLNNEKTSSPKKELDVVASYKKKMDKSLEAFNSFPEKKEALIKEIEIISEYLPKPLSAEELSAAVDRHIGLGDFGKIMKALRGDLGDFFNGKELGPLIKGRLDV